MFVLCSMLIVVFAVNFIYQIFNQKLSVKDLM